MMRFQGGRGRNAVVAVMLLSTACRTYAHVAPETVAAGSPARVRLTDRGSVDLAVLLGPRARAVEGRIVEQDSGRVVMAVSSVVRENGDEEPWRGERVAVPRGAANDISVPRLSRGRSGLLGAGLVAAAVLLGRALAGNGESVGSAGGGGPAGGR